MNGSIEKKQNNFLKPPHLARFLLSLSLSLSILTAISINLVQFCPGKTAEEHGANQGFDAMFPLTLSQGDYYVLW
jgi:hypothetical protein